MSIEQLLAKINLKNRPVQKKRKIKIRHLDVKEANDKAKEKELSDIEAIFNKATAPLFKQSEELGKQIVQLRKGRKYDDLSGKERKKLSKLNTALDNVRKRTRVFVEERNEKRDNIIRETRKATGESRRLRDTDLANIPLKTRKPIGREVNKFVEDLQDISDVAGAGKGRQGGKDLNIDFRTDNRETVDTRAINDESRRAKRIKPPEQRKTPGVGQQPSVDRTSEDPNAAPEVNQDENWELEVIPKEVPISDIEKKERHNALLKGLHTMLGVQDALGSITQARLQYQQVQGQSDINKRLIDDEIQDTLSAGNQQAAIEHARGKTAAESDQLRLAAQGQSLSGAGAERVEQSHQVMAAANAADARSASIARGLGLEYEKVSLDRQLAYADINKTAATWRGLTSAAFGLAEASIHAKRAKIGYGDTKTVYEEVLKRKTNRSPAGEGPSIPVKRRTRVVENYRRDSKRQNKRFGY